MLGRGRQNRLGDCGRLRDRTLADAEDLLEDVALVADRMIAGVGGLGAVEEGGCVVLGAGLVGEEIRGVIEADLDDPRGWDKLFGILPHSGPVAVSIDGELRGVLQPGDWVGVYQARTRLRMVRLGPTDFYRRVRERFRLTDAPATAVDGEAPALFPPPTSDLPEDMAGLQLPPYQP